MFILYSPIKLISCSLLSSSIEMFEILLDTWKETFLIFVVEDIP